MYYARVALDCRRDILRLADFLWFHPADFQLQLSTFAICQQLRRLSPRIAQNDFGSFHSRLADLQRFLERIDCSRRQLATQLANFYACSSAPSWI